jgi:hemerythrin-like domain-containing protein
MHFQQTMSQVHYRPMSRCCQCKITKEHWYARLLRDHIEKENNVLFVMSERQLPPEEHTRLLEGFERIEQERIGPGVHERYHAMLDRLRDEYLVTSEEECIGDK